MSSNLQSMIEKRCSSALLPQSVRGARFTVEPIDPTVWEHLTEAFHVVMYQPDAGHVTLTVLVDRRAEYTEYKVDAVRYTPEYGYEVVNASTQYSTRLDAWTLEQHSHDWSIAEAVFRFLHFCGDKVAAPQELAVLAVQEAEEMDIVDHDPTLLYLTLTDQL